MKKKQDLINKIAQETTISKSVVHTIVTAFLTALQTNLIDGEEVRLSEIGTFKQSTYKPRKGYNPITGERTDLPETRLYGLNQINLLLRTLMGSILIKCVYKGFMFRFTVIIVMDDLQRP